MLIAPQEGNGAPISQMRLNSRCTYNRIVWSRVIVKCETDCEAVSVWEPEKKNSPTGHKLVETDTCPQSPNLSPLGTGVKLLVAE